MTSTTGNRFASLLLAILRNASAPSSTSSSFSLFTTSQSPRDTYDTYENLRRACLPSCIGMDDTKTKEEVPTSGRLVVELNGDNQTGRVQRNSDELEEQLQKLEFELGYRSSLADTGMASNFHRHTVQDGDSSSDYDEAEASETSSLSDDEPSAKTLITNWI